MNKKLKQSNRLALLFLTFFCLCGGLLIFRSNNQLVMYQGVFTKAEISEGFGNHGKSHAIILDFHNFNREYGIYAGTKEQADRILKNLELIEGSRYKVFIDPSVIVDLNEIQLGIRKIQSDSKIIYEENMNAHKIFGSLLIFLGIISSVSLYLIAKQKFK